MVKARSSLSQVSREVAGTVYSPSCSSKTPSEVQGGDGVSDPGAQGQAEEAAVFVGREESCVQSLLVAGARRLRLVPTTVPVAVR